MIKTIMLSGRPFEKDGKYYFKNVDEVINEFLEENNIEYVDLKVLNGDKYEVLLIYREPEVKVLSECEYNDEFGIKEVI